MLTNQLKSSTGVGIHANFSTATHLRECLPFQSVIAQRVEMTYNADGQPYRILQGVDLLIRQGDIQLLMGSSGSGKTTLLSILAGILTPTSGRVHLLGQDITQMSRNQLANFRLLNIGFIFQGFNLFSALTASENVELALQVKGMRNASQRRQTARCLLEQVKLGDRQDHRPRDLSGGQKQRVAVARALAGNPPIIMADEPTAALDAHSGSVVMKLLRDLAKQNASTVIIVTHDSRLIGIADQVAFLEDGILTSSS